MVLLHLPTYTSRVKCIIAIPMPGTIGFIDSEWGVCIVAVVSITK